MRSSTISQKHTPTNSLSLFISLSFFLIPPHTQRLLHFDFIVFFATGGIKLPFFFFINSIHNEWSNKPIINSSFPGSLTVIIKQKILVAIFYWQSIFCKTIAALSMWQNIEVQQKNSVAKIQLQNSAGMWRWGDGDWMAFWAMMLTRAIKDKE